MMEFMYHNLLHNNHSNNNHNKNYILLLQNINKINKTPNKTINKINSITPIYKQI